MADRPPRRPDGARICSSCLQEFPQGRGYAEHQCPGRPAPELAKRRVWAENQAITRPYPDTGNAKADLDQVFAERVPREKGTFSTEQVRELMLEAWYFGYTNGRADAAMPKATWDPTFEAKAKTWNPMKQAYE